MSDFYVLLQGFCVQQVFVHVDKCVILWYAVALTNCIDLKTDLQCIITYIWMVFLGIFHLTKTVGEAGIF